VARDSLDELMEDVADAEEDGRLDKALSLVAQVIAQDPRRSDAWKSRVRLLMALDRLDEAFASATEAAALFPGTTTHRLSQARVHVRRRDWSAAATTYRAILQDHPLSLNAIRELMDFEPVGIDDPLARTLAAHRDDPALKPYDRASTWFLLGQIHMNAGLDDAAFDLYDEGNRLMRELHAGARAEYGFSRLLPELDAAFQRRHAPGVAPAPCPLMIVTGMPRSGKTLVEKLLASQPSLVAGGETGRIYNLFLEVDRSQGADAAMRNLLRPPVSPVRRYFERLLTLSGKTGATRVIDTTPGNLEQLAFLGPMHPDVPVVFVRRDPVDLAAAMYFKQFNTAHRYTYDLGTAARAIARAEHLMRRWTDTLPNPMIDVTYEQTVEDPVGTAMRILNRFGLSADRAALMRAAADDGRQLNLAPGRSLDGVGAVRRDLVGFAGRFGDRLAAVKPAYLAERRALA